MFIKTLRLENFRCFEELELSFDDSLAEGNRLRTLILGENGTGKSNILKAIALVTAGSDALGELLGVSDNWIRYGAERCRIALELSTQRGELRDISLEIHRGDTLSGVMKRSDDSLQQIDDALRHAERNYFVAGYGASRILGSGGGNHGHSGQSQFYDSQRARCIASLLDRQAALNSLEAWAIDLDYQDGESGLEIIRKVFDDFLPGIQFAKIDKKTRQLILDTPDGLVPLDSLSDGYQNMASWIGDLLFRVNDIFHDRKDPLNVSGVLLLDEIDLHLHPVWQRILLSFISETFPRLQLIATTHSPFTAQQAGRGELFTLERGSEGLHLDPFQGNPQEMLLHQLVMSEAFGMETDESVHVESLKHDHDHLKCKHGLEHHEKQKLEEIEERLSSIPSKSYSNSLVTDEERKVSKDILRMYKAKRDGNVEA